MKYDFILFENAYQLENHYLDLELLALVLKRAGYNVAIADVYKENIFCKNKEIPHISLKCKPYGLFRKQSIYRHKVSSIQYTYLRFLCNIYLIYTLYVLRKQSKRIYVGSLTIDTPLLWLILSPLKNEIYIWGLRSYVLQRWKENLVSRYGLYSFFLYIIVRYFRRIKLVVSNEIIRNEFKHIIIAPDNRMIVRPERWIPNDYKIDTQSNVNHKTTFLTIGTLRRNKHVELVLDALRKCVTSDFEYIIAGRCKDDNGYEELLTKRAEGIKQVRRINRFIPDEEYEQLFDKADCIILCDEKEKSCGTNGTMLEALLKRKPIIAPRHEPFISEIGKTKVGLLYDMSSIDTLSQCIDTIVTGKHEPFEPNIEIYLESFKEASVVNSIKEQIKQNENN